jgi:transposase
VDHEERRRAKERFVTAMLCGRPWEVAAQDAAISPSRATAYRWAAAARSGGLNSMTEGRHGHASKLRAPVRAWMVAYCRASPQVTSRTVQGALAERFGVVVSVRQINYVRAALGVSRRPRRPAAPDMGGKSGHRCTACARMAGRGRWLAAPCCGARDRPSCRARDSLFGRDR